VVRALLVADDVVAAVSGIATSTSGEVGFAVQLARSQTPVNDSIPILFNQYMFNLLWKVIPVCSGSSA
jgi:hypothetical protein